MKFAFLILGNFNCKKDYAEISGGTAKIIGVASVEEAAEVAEALYKDGTGCIELCGAFGADGAKAIIKATENKIPVGFVTHLPEQDEVYAAAFSE